MEKTNLCREILDELENSQVSTKRDFNSLKTKVLSRYGAAQIPKNADIYFSASESEREKYKKILGIKPVRTLSGVAPIALMTEPYPCPHTMKGIGPCSYCPGGPGSPFGDVPQSYTGKEPSTRRSMRNNYDPYLIVFNRLEHYIAMDKIPDKVELIIQGGTFTFFPKAYQEYFVKYALKAMNDFSNLFFNGAGNLNLEKFKRFFELPKNIEEDERTRRVNKKLQHIKHLELSDEDVSEKINNILFNNFFLEENNESKDYATASAESSKNENRNINNANPNVLAISNIQKKLKEENDRMNSGTNGIGNENLTIKSIQKQNESSFIRCVGLTIETKSDFGKLYHGNMMLELGCTRVELGIQSVYDKILEATDRGNTVQDNIESIRILKDLGFKINMHYMPGMPFTAREMDEEGLRQLFDNPDYRPDMLKIYPCMVLEGTKLYDDWKKGKFAPLSTKEAAEIIADFKKYVPEYCRIMRVQRDIPTNMIAGGVDRTNLRQYIERVAIQKGIKCRCIRCREAGIFLNKNRNIRIDIEDIEITVMQYEASHGMEFFISAENVKNDALFGFVRLRFPSQFLRPEITKTSALIRELHVFSSAVQIGKKDEDSFQHKGIGKSLMKNAEEIAKQNGKDKIVVISGIGARNYFRKLGYELEGVYMVKKLL